MKKINNIHQIIKKAYRVFMAFACAFGCFGIGAFTAALSAYGVNSTTCVGLILSFVVVALCAFNYKCEDKEAE